MKSSLRTGLQRPRSRHENGLPFSCVPNCKIGVPFTFMIPFDNDCPENMEDIEQVKVSTKDYCVDIPLNRKATVCRYCRMAMDPIKHTLEATYEGKQTFIYPNEEKECNNENIAFHGTCRK